MKAAGFTLLLGIATMSAWAQPLRVYSEFAQVDAKGKVTSPADPREILSPALARNAFASFQIVVDSLEGKPWQLYIAQNPENAVVATLYRENGTNLAPAAQPVSGSGTQVFWMDVWVDRNAPVRRIKVEPQLNINNDWVIYPMEGRVVEVMVPDPGPNGKWAEGTATPTEVIRGLVCDPNASNETQNKSATSVSVVTSRFRNAQQDRALAAKAAKAELAEKFGSCDAREPANDPESYYRIRDYLLQP